MYASQTPNENPGVLMERAEAEALYGAIDRARIRIVAACGTVERSRIGRNSGANAAKLEELRADLATLQAFAQALGEAHNLGGY